MAIPTSDGDDTVFDGDEGRESPNAVFVAWRPPAPHGDWRVVGRLNFGQGLYRFCYTHGARQSGFCPFPQMPDLERVYESKSLFPIFANRLLLSAQHGYKVFLRQPALSIADPADPLLIRGRTEGLWLRDVLEVFPCPRPDEEGCYQNKFFLHGVYWMSDAAQGIIFQLEDGEELKLMVDSQNEYDANAVAVRTEIDRMLIGYVPRYLAPDVRLLLNSTVASSIRLNVERLVPDAPMENRVLCRLHARWPDGFAPCTGDNFDPIPVTVGPVQPAMIGRR